MRRRRVLLALLVVLPALAFGGARIHFDRERAEIAEGWSAGDADATLGRALDGVRVAFGEMADDAADAARRVSRAVESLDYAAAPEDEEVEELFERLFATERAPEVTGVLVLDRAGTDLAWDGRIQDLAPELRDAVRTGEPLTAVVTSELHSSIAAVVPFGCEKGLRGSAVAFLPFDVTIPLNNRYLPRLGIEEELADRLGVASVRIRPPAEDRPHMSRLGDVLSASLELDDERVVATVEIEGLTLEGRLARLERREAAWTAGLGALFALAAALVALGLVLRRLPRLLRPIVGGGILIGLRYALRAVGFPAAIGPDEFLDPTDFATTYLGGLLGNPGELLLSALILGAVASLVARSTVGLLSEGPGEGRRIVFPALAGVAGLVAVTYAWNGLRFLVRAMVFESTLDYIAPEAIWPEGPLLLMVVSLFLLVGSFLLVGFSVVSPLSRVLAAIRPVPVAARWAVLGLLLAGLLSLFDAAEESWLPPVAAGLLAGAGWFVESGRVRRFPAFLALSTLAGTILAFSVLAPTVEDVVRSDLRSEVREFTRTYGREAAIRRLLVRAKSSPAVRAALAAEPRRVPELAFSVWANSSLNSQGIDCDLEILTPDGFTVSRWEVRMPPASWLPDPRPGRSLDRIQTVTVEGLEGATGQTFIVGSGPVLGEDDAYLGTVIVRAPSHEGATRGRAPPEILRNVDETVASSGRRLRRVSWYRGDELIDSTDPGIPRTTRAPPDVVEALLHEDGRYAWRREEYDGRGWITLYVDWDPPDDPEAMSGLLAASVPVPGLLEILRFFLKLMLVGSILALVLYVGHLLLRVRRFQFRFQHKLLLSYLILSALPVALLARVNTDLAVDRFRESMEDRLRESLGVVSRKLGRTSRHGLDVRLPDLLDHPDGIAPVSSEWCKAEGWRLNRDVNVYVVSHLRASSEPSVFRTELFSNRLSGRAFLEIVVRKREFFARRERAGSYSFLTGYTPLRDPTNDEVIGAIGIPMFWRQGSLDLELAQQNTTLLAIYLLTLIFVVFIGIFLSRRISSPIERLAEATNRLGGGDLTYRIPHGPRDEFGELVESFNRMAQDLAESREQIVRAEKDAAWREMARQVAHEIKNPLTPMKLAAQQILRAWDDRHPDMDRILRRSGETIVRQVENLRRIASDFGDFARVSVAEARPISVDGPVREALALYAGLAERGIVLEPDLADGLSPVRADSADLKRVLINLLQNASQALETNGGGVVRVATRMTTVRFEGEEHPFVEIVVTDDGPGIPEANLERVFEPNFSTKSGGTGLGLAICRQIVEGLGGQIEVENGPASGATVRMSLPALP